MNQHLAANTRRNTEEWGTPQYLFDALDREFGFDLDPCATPDNAKCARFFMRDQDGLAQEWSGVVFMNPPFRYCGAWVKKAYETARRGHTVVCLLPSRTDTDWWHAYALQGEIRWIRGRLRYEGGRYNAPFPSVIVIFRGREDCEEFEGV